MRDWYKAGDKKFASLERENAKIFRKSRLTLDFDNINQPVRTIRSVARQVYRRLKQKSDKAYLDIGLLVYMEAFEEATDTKKTNMKAEGTEPEVPLPVAEISEKSKKAIDEKWLEEFHREYNPVTKYVYENELERKQARFFESIVADVEAKDRHEMESDYKAAENAWKRQTRQAMIDTEDRAAVTAYRDAGVEEVMWISVCDNRTCEECSALNGLIFPVDRVPDKPHYNCRCHLEPVKRLPKDNPDGRMNLQLFALKSSDFETVHLSKDEYAMVIHEINTNLTAEERERKVVSKAIGDYVYYFENHGFNSYRIFDKILIDDIGWDEE